MTKRQVFFSFHYDEDVWRVAQVRNIGTVEGQLLFSDNGWEKIRKTSDEAIKRWIDKELEMRSCVVVLIGAHTASRKWVKYEIEQAWKKRKGIVGIYIHKLENYSKKQANKGENPFDSFYVDRSINYIAERKYPLDGNEIIMSSVCKVFDSNYYSSNYVYQDIANNIEDLIEEAIAIRNRFPK